MKIKSSASVCFLIRCDLKILNFIVINWIHIYAYNHALYFIKSVNLQISDQARAMIIDPQQVFDERIRRFKKAIRQYQQAEVRQVKQKSEEQQAYQHNKLIKQNMEHYEGQFEKKFKGVEVDFKIQKSRKINEMRMSKMKLRFEMIQKIQQDIKDRMCKTMEKSSTYEQLLRKLMIQGMIKLLEEKIEVQCLRKDLALVKEVAQKCQKQFSEMCTIQSKLLVNENHCIPDKELGGIILTSYNGRIVCNNTLRVRLEYAFQMFLPDVRKQLFGSNQFKKKDLLQMEIKGQKQEKLDEKILQVAQKFGQKHLLQHYKSLRNLELKKNFLNQLQGINFEQSASLFKNVYLASKLPKQEKAPEYHPIKNVANRQVLNESENEFNQIGLQRISQGQAGVCIMSGGQGTRLGFDHPKGMYDIGLDSHYSLFEFFARRLLGLMNVVKKQFPGSRFTNKNMIKWYIMTSEMNNDQVIGFFKQHKYFGYDPESIVFFPQGGIPALDYQGRIVIEEEGKISLAPGGNGVIYEQMLNKGVLKHMKKHGVKYIYLGPVDNILLKLADPTCLGYMVKNKFDIVSLYVSKISAEQKVGLHLLCNGKAKICEYTETTKQVKQSKDENGEFIYKHGSRATMYITVDFIESITTNKEVVERINKSYHLAEKKIKYFDSKEKKSVKPDKNNGVKFELFYFDVFEQTDKFGLFETIREDQFAPVKNADGDDSPASARQLLRNLHMKWIKNAGIEVEGDGYVEIDPLLCYNGEGLNELVNQKFGSDKISLPVFIK